MNDTPTPTPRTDEASCNSKTFDSPMGAIDFARTLERELTAAREELKAVTEQRDGLRSGIDYASDQLTRVTEQRDKALQKIKNQAERIAYLEGATNHATGTPLSKAIEQRDRLVAGLEVAQQVGIQLGEQRDRMAEALRKIQKVGLVAVDAFDELDRIDEIVDEALSAVKGGSDE